MSRGGGQSLAPPGKLRLARLSNAGDPLLKVTTEIFESDEAHARIGPSSKGAQAIEFTVCPGGRVEVKEEGSDGGCCCGCAVG